MTSIRNKIKSANADQWIKGQEALDVVAEAQKQGVTKAEYQAVKEWRKQFDEDGFKVAPGTRKAVDNFLARHDYSRNLNLEVAPKAALGKIFDQMDFWHGQKENGLVNLSYSKVPAEVRKAYEAELRGNGLSAEEVRQNTRDLVGVFKFPVRDQWVYGLHSEDNSGFSIDLYSPKGRKLWENSGQVD